MDNLSKEVLKEPTSPIYIVAKDNVILPIDGKQNKRLPESIYETQGWDEGLPFDCSTVNYIWNNHGKWIDYLNKQRPIDLDAINKRIDELNKKHAEDIVGLTKKHDTDISTINTKHKEDIDAANQRMTAMQIKVGGYYHGGSTNPATHLLYGTWLKLDADLTLRSAGEDGDITGDNEPAVPLKKHKHTSTQTQHSHEVWGMTTGGGGDPDPLESGCIAGEVTTVAGYVSTGSSGNALVKGVSPSISVADTGEDNPTLDVRGKHIPCVIWKRSS